MICLFNRPVRRQFHHRSPDHRFSRRNPTLYEFARCRLIKITIISGRFQAELKPNTLVNNTCANFVIVPNANTIYAKFFQAFPDCFIFVPNTERMQDIPKISFRLIDRIINIYRKTLRCSILVSVFCISLFKG